MDKERYFAIRAGEDTPWIEVIEDIHEWLDDLSVEYLEYKDPVIRWADCFDLEGDNEIYKLGEKILLIKGVIVTPKVVQAVTKFTIED